MVASIVAGTAVEASIIRILSSSPLLNSKIATKKPLFCHLSSLNISSGDLTYKTLK